ncbi:unnamed protein product [Microthlaspi erraticum]|uniref:HhH-GPD domain-containing protein n=1 Tax=Microthlaspi erraticum TaxID=1685480 RepID=A0A6D2IQI8_9BRAS|nr:unnamed protein product [Microthlaspi erraticum]
MRTISMRKRKNEKGNEEQETIAEPKTPQKQSFPKRRKTEAKRKNVARTLIFDDEKVPICLKLSRKPGPNFPKGRRRMAAVRRTDLRGLISPISFSVSIWKRQSRRSHRKKNVVRWARIALSFQCLEGTLPLVTILPKDNSISSQTDVSLKTEDKKMITASNVAAKVDPVQSKGRKRTKDVVEHHKVQKQRIKKPVDVEKLSIKDKSHEKNECQSVVVQKQRMKKPVDVEKLSIKDKKPVDVEKLSIKDVPVQVQIQETPVTASSNVNSKLHKKRMKEFDAHLIQQLNYQKEHGLSSLADVPLHMEDTLMRSVCDVVQERPVKKAKDVAKLIKALSRLNLNKTRVTALGKAKKQLVTAKVDLDPETIKEWELLMENDSPSRSYADEETESKWKEKREIFKAHIELFINRMHQLQGNRKFKKWKGSVVDSVVGVFLTQNVSDYLSSNAFMSVAAKFPIDVKESLESLAYSVEEPLEVNDSVVDEQRPIHSGDDDAKSLPESISFPENVEKRENVAQRKNKKTGIMEDEKVDWKNLRKMFTKEGHRDVMHEDIVDWDAVRLTDQQNLANTIKKRGQHNELARKILKFLNDEAEQNGTVDLEWLRDGPSDLVKRYLLEIEGIGLKSAECVRLLGLKHAAFPVDTNVGRIAVRLGWVPLEPLSNGVQMHQLFHYPSMDAIQKYLWTRLCKLPLEILYELHYQLITFGKVFCTKVIPNCNACPMKSECKYFASAYVSSSTLLEGPKEKTHEPDSSMPSDYQDVGANLTSKINSIEEYVASECSNQNNCCESVVEFPSAPSTEIPELIDIEDTPCRTPCQSHEETPEIGIVVDKIPETGFDMDALKKNVMDALSRSGKMQESISDEVSKALVLLTPQNALITMELPHKLKYYDRLRTEHLVYVLPDNHELLNGFEKRAHDDPSPYLLALWQPGETLNSSSPPKQRCELTGLNFCKFKSCSRCWSLREEESNIYRGTILIPCRTATRAGFPLNGTYFQTNEVFADYETSVRPIVFPRELCDGLEKRALYCGSSVTSIFRLLDGKRVRFCFWAGFVCMRAFDRKSRYPKGLVRRLHTPPDERGEKYDIHEDY